MTEQEIRDTLRVLVKDHAHYKQWLTRYQNALKLKANGEAQKMPTEYHLTEEYRDRINVLLAQAETWTGQSARQIAVLVKQLPIWTEWAQGVCGIGEISIGYLEALVDLEKASKDGLVVVSKVWRFAGYGDPGDKGAPGKRKYCAALKTQLYQLGLSLEKSRTAHPSKYGEIYDGLKARLEQSERIVPEWGKNGKAEVAWKDAKPCHRRDAAIRRMVKEVLVDYVKARAALAGREVRKAYDPSNPHAK